MPGVLAALLDKRSRAMRAARLRAWWDGEEFDEAATVAVIDEALAKPEATKPDKPEKPSKSAKATADSADPAEALFDSAPAPLLPRLEALQKFWGEGRIMPGDTVAEAAAIADLGLAEDAVLVVLGPGLAAPIVSCGKAFKGRIVALEWRGEARDALAATLKGKGAFEVSNVDLAAFAGEPAAFHGAVSLDEFTYADADLFAPALAACLRAGARAVIETYVAEAHPSLGSAFATAFAEPKLRSEDSLIAALTSAGFAVEANEDRTEAHVEQGRAGFKHLERALADPTAAHGMNVAILQEIAWEATAWRVRTKLLTQRRLQRRRIVARKAA